MSLPFVDRPPTANEVERIRLCLSTFQDGTGMEGGGTLPGWRDFERSVAAALLGTASESKAIFDVVLERKEGPPVPKYGLSCKMRGELNRIDRDGRVTIEVSNSAGKFWDYLRTKGITTENYTNNPAKTGQAVVELVYSWHYEVSTGTGGEIDLSKSSYLVLSWNKNHWYQLHQYKLDIVNPAKLTWRVPQSRDGNGHSRRVCGNDGIGDRVEWYGLSGGQLKYYPFAKESVWQSDRFQLEPLPERTYGLSTKVEVACPRFVYHGKS